MKPYLQYLVILLDDTSVAYCHADNPLKERNLMPIETLKKAILFGMKQNLMIQYVYPEYELPAEYDETIESIDNLKIGRDVKVTNEVPTAVDCDNIVLRIKIKDLIAKQYDIAALLPNVKRMNICLTDIETFKDEQIDEYKKALNTLSTVIVNLYKEQKHQRFHNAHNEGKPQRQGYKQPMIDGREGKLRPRPVYHIGFQIYKQWIHHITFF